MKSIAKFFLAGAALLTLASCGKMLDAIAPKGSISTDKLTDSDISLLTNGVMHQFEAVVSNLWYEGDYLAENFRGGPGASDKDYHAETQSASANLALSRWNYCYGKLQYANLLLDSAAGKTTPEAQEALAVGHFFRAWLYYNLVIRYGGVPLITEPTTLDPSVQRVSEAEIWDFIFAELDRADAALAAAGVTFTSFAYVSPEAVNMLRALCKLWRGDYAGAITAADAVMGSAAGFQLSASSEDWARMFINGTSSREIIFAPINIRSSSYIRLYESVNDTDGSFNFSPAVQIYQHLFDDGGYKTGDKRKAPTFGSDVTRVIKFPNGQDGQFIANPAPSESPLVAYRLAEAYMIKAEAQWLNGHLDDAKTTLVALMRTRYTSVNLSTVTTDADFEKLLLDEYQREFFAEGRKWFVIKRLAIRRHGYVSFNDYSSKDFPTWIRTIYPGATSYSIDGWNDRHQLMYWPIPQDERDKSGGALTQNPGYEQ